MHATVKQMVQRGRCSHNGAVLFGGDFPPGLPANQTLIRTSYTHWVQSVSSLQACFLLPSDVTPLSPRLLIVHS